MSAGIEVIFKFGGFEDVGAGFERTHQSGDGSLGDFAQFGFALGERHLTLSPPKGRSGSCRGFRAADSTGGGGALVQEGSFASLSGYCISPSALIARTESFER